jgi:hypothetical protein
MKEGVYNNMKDERIVSLLSIAKRFHDNSTLDNQILTEIESLSEEEALLVFVNIAKQSNTLSSSEFKKRLQPRKGFVTLDEQCLAEVGKEFKVTDQGE